MEDWMISVDRWRSGSQVYFLTHLHSDHTAGLTAAWKRGPLFCSRLTARLFPIKFPGFDLSLLRVLDINRWYSVPLISPSCGSKTTLRVMAIDADHCPGAVMFLFRGEFGCVLYTGDFRWEKECSRSQHARTVLIDALENEKIHVLHLDNTYCNPRYAFPSRENAARQIVDIITANPNHEIIIGIDSLGKEDLLVYIARLMNIKVWVWPERLQVMDLLGFHDFFTTKTSLTRVRAVPRYSFSIETLEGLNKFCPTIGIMPSGLPWAVKAVKGNVNPFGSSPSNKRKRDMSFSASSKTHEPNEDSGRYHEYIYKVPYSDHSCFSEIKDFIDLLRPVRIKGMLSSSDCYVEPLYYFHHLCGSKQAFWRLQQKPENHDEVENFEASTVESVEVTSTASSRKRKINGLSFFGIRISRVSLLRRLSRGVRITDAE